MPSSAPPRLPWTGLSAAATTRRATRPRPRASCVRSARRSSSASTGRPRTAPPPLSTPMPTVCTLRPTSRWPTPRSRNTAASRCRSTSPMRRAGRCLGQTPLTTPSRPPTTCMANPPGTSPNGTPGRNDMTGESPHLWPQEPSPTGGRPEPPTPSHQQPVGSGDREPDQLVSADPVRDKLLRTDQPEPDGQGRPDRLAEIRAMPAWVEPEAFRGSIGRTMFDTPGAKDNTITVLLPYESVQRLPAQSLVRISSHPDRRQYLGIVVAGPFAAPDGLRADAPSMVTTAVRGAVFMPRYHGWVQVELLGEQTAEGTLVPPRLRPLPNSPVFALDSDQTAETLRVDGTLQLGVAAGDEAIEVKVEGAGRACCLATRACSAPPAGASRPRSAASSGKPLPTATRSCCWTPRVSTPSSTSPPRTPPCSRR